MTAIHTSLIPPVCIKEDTIETIAATGEVRNYKLADLGLTINGEKHVMEAAVADELPVPALLGKDLPLVKPIVNGLTRDQLAEYMTKTNRVKDTESPKRDDTPKTIKGEPCCNYKMSGTETSQSQRANPTRGPRGSG